MHISAMIIQKALVILGVITFLSIGVFGLAGSGMVMNTEGHMSNCPFMGVTALCTMNAFEHIAAWQSMFAALPSQIASTLFALLTLFLLATFFFRCLRDKRAFELIPLPSQRFRDRVSIIQSPLQEAFSRGILNSKKY